MFCHIALAAFLGLLALKLIRHHRYACAGRGGFTGGPPWARHHHRHHHHGGGRPRLLWHALARLDLTPAQEKVVKAEVEQLKDKARNLKDEGKSARGDLARAVRGDDFDEEALAAMFIRHDELLHGLRGDLAGALGRVHAVLDASQRERLAELIERGAGRGPWGGPYR
jgi:uncharacterized membrane protein